MRCVNVGATRKKEMANEKSLDAAEQKRKQKAQEEAEKQEIKVKGTGKEIRTLPLEAGSSGR